MMNVKFRISNDEVGRGQEIGLYSIGWGFNPSSKKYNFLPALARNRLAEMKAWCQQDENRINFGCEIDVGCPVMRNLKFKMGGSSATADRCWLLGFSVITALVVKYEEHAEGMQQKEPRVRRHDATLGLIEA